MGPLARIETVARILSMIAAVGDLSQVLADRYAARLRIAQSSRDDNALVVLAVDLHNALREMRG